MTLQELLHQTEQASVELHSAMLQMDAKLGELRKRVQELEVARYEQSAIVDLDVFSKRHDRIGAM